MNEISVVWLSYRSEIPSGIERGVYWDQTMLHDLFDGEIWSWANQYTFKHTEKLQDASDGAVVVLPARNQAQYAGQLNDELRRFKWVVLMLTGDEESVFPYELINHPNMRTWVMSPQIPRHNHARRLGSGYTPGQRDFLKERGYQPKTLDWFYAGQSNHSRRRECAAQLADMPDGLLKETNGFSQGYPQVEYWQHLAEAKIAPVPSGGHTPDTFRLFEALESGCFPIADEVTEVIRYDLGYWEWFFQTPLPFYPLTDWGGIKEYTKQALIGWPANGNKVFAWWMQQKRQMAYNLRQDIKEVSGMDFNDDITVLMPTSVIESHPSTAMIEKTIADVRTKLPTAEIIVMFDGLRPQFEERRAAYEEYKSRLLWKMNHEMKNVVPLIFDEPTHQVGMTRKALEMVKTPCILFVEHDSPLTPDVEFDYSFDSLVKTILSGEANVVRFAHESHVLDEHKELMIGEVEKVDGVPMLRTMQWSQRPHLASTAWYRRMLEQNFAPDAFGMIEDHLYGKVLTDCKDSGMMGWLLWRIWLFHPLDGQIKRSYTVDGRGLDSKFDDEFHY